MRKFWVMVFGLFLLVFFLTVLSNNFQVKIDKSSKMSQYACVPPIKPPPVPKSH